MEKGKIIQVSGPVIDVLFEKGNLPHIKDALKVDNHGKECVMEVAKHMGPVSYTHLTRDTDRPTLTAGRIPALKRSLSRKI